MSQILEPLTRLILQPGYHPAMTIARTLTTLVGTSLVCGVLAGCSNSRIYSQSWRPEEKGGAMSPRVLAAALFLTDSSDIDVINRAGGTLIGWHDARDSWAMRAASTGGTHFAPIHSPPPGDRSGCYLWGDIPMCSSGRKARQWSRIAVFRVSPDRWHALPAHLIPTDSDVIAGPASAVRAGCRNVHQHYGMVRCDAGWHVVTNPTVAANIPPVVPVTEGPIVNGPRGPAVGQPDESRDEVEP